MGSFCALKTADRVCRRFDALVDSRVFARHHAAAAAAAAAAASAAFLHASAITSAAHCCRAYFDARARALVNAGERATADANCSCLLLFFVGRFFVAHLALALTMSNSSSGVVLHSSLNERLRLKCSQQFGDVLSVSFGMQSAESM